MKRRLRIVTVFIFLLTLSVFAFAADTKGVTQVTTFTLQGAYYPANHTGYLTEGFAPLDYTVIDAEPGYRKIGSSWGGLEVKAALSRAFTVPLLRGPGAFFSGNNLKVTGTAELSPISLNGIVDFSLTPIAFLKLGATAGIGTGWSLDALGFKGLALNPADDYEDLRDMSFAGAVWYLRGAGTFQFDLAALAPGDWTHIVTQLNAEFEYKAFTGAAAGEAWLWEADKGENFNAWRYNGTYVLGYQMPIKLNFAGFMIETEQWLGAFARSSPMATGWGSDFVTVNLGPMANLQFTDKAALLMLLQFKRGRDWTDSTTLFRYFGNRDYERAFWYFNRFAFSFSYKF